MTSCGGHEKVPKNTLSFRQRDRKTESQGERETFGGARLPSTPVSKKSSLSITKDPENGISLVPISTLLGCVSATNLSTASAGQFEMVTLRGFKMARARGAWRVGGNRRWSRLRRYTLGVRMNWKWTGPKWSEMNKQISHKRFKRKCVYSTFVYTLQNLCKKSKTIFDFLHRFSND